jgi:FlaA1/EpsC-like NDP-sugar epimerase
MLTTKEEYERLITGRTESLFREEMENSERALADGIAGARILVVGAAGSIGAAVVKLLARFRPGGLALFDLSENNLVELVRDLRSTPGLCLPDDFQALPIGMGSREFDLYVRDVKPFDLFLNLAAMKHVRSEKDIYCILRMLDTNVLSLHRFLDRVPYNFRRAFSVSSDKAVSPANVMGASKAAMEKTLLYHSSRHLCGSARFANVAFSDGSLPFGFLHRLAKRQPLSAPRDVRRFFISHQEAGELCVLSCVLGKSGEVFFPNLQSGSDEKTFSEIAVQVLKREGFEPVLFSDEGHAKAEADSLIRKGKWPCLFFDSNTSGEKPFEEFVGPGEAVMSNRFRRVGVVQSRMESEEKKQFEQFLCVLEKPELDRGMNKESVLSALSSVVPSFQHIETGRNLDQKM